MKTPLYHHTFHPWETSQHQQEPLKWNHDWQELNQTLKVTDNPRILCSDWLADVPIEWLTNLLKLIHQTPHVRWLLLSRHPKNWAKRIDEVCKLWACDGSYHETAEARAYHELLCPWRAGKPPHNVWIGTPVENQEQADKRIPDLLQIPAKVRFLSCEPLLREVKLELAYPEGFAVCSARDCGHWGEWDGIRECVECSSREDNPDNGNCAKCDKGTMRDICPTCECSDYSGECYEHPSYFAEGHKRLPGIDWVICGGGTQPMHPDWARSLRDQCKAASVPFFFTDWGDWEPVHTSNVDQAKDIRFLELNGTDSTDWPLDQHSSTTAMMGRLSTKNNTLLDGHKHHALPTSISHDR